MGKNFDEKRFDTWQESMRRRENKNLAMVNAAINIDRKPNVILIELFKVTDEHIHDNT